MTREFKPAPGYLREHIQSTADRYALSYEEIERQLWAESNYNPNAVGPETKYGRARGIAQFIDSTAKEWGVNPTDIGSSIDGLGKYMRWLTDQFDGDKNMARAAYNWGIGNVKSKGIGKLPKETEQYLGYFAGLDGGTPTDTTPTSTVPATRGTPGVASEFRERIPASDYGFGVWTPGTKPTRGRAGLGSDKANPYIEGGLRTESPPDVDQRTFFSDDAQDTARYGSTWQENFLSALTDGSYTGRAINLVRSLNDSDGWRANADTYAELVSKGYDQQIPYIMNANGTADFNRRKEQSDNQRTLAQAQIFENQWAITGQQLLGSSFDPLGVAMGAAVGAGFKVSAMARAAAKAQGMTRVERVAAMELAATHTIPRAIAEGAITDFAGETGFQLMESGQVDWHSVALEVALGQGLLATTMGAQLGAAGVSSLYRNLVQDADTTAFTAGVTANNTNKKLALLEPDILDVPIGPTLRPTAELVVQPRNAVATPVAPSKALYRHNWTETQSTAAYANVLPGTNAGVTMNLMNAPAAESTVGDNMAPMTESTPTGIATGSTVFKATVKSDFWQATHDNVTALFEHANTKSGERFTPKADALWVERTFPELGKSGSTERVFNATAILGAANRVLQARALRTDLRMRQRLREQYPDGIIPQAELDNVQDKVNKYSLLSYMAGFLNKRLEGQALPMIVSNNDNTGTHRAFATARFGGAFVLFTKDGFTRKLDENSKVVSTADLVANMTDRGLDTTVHESIHSVTMAAMYAYDANPNNLDAGTRQAVADIKSVLQELRTELDARGIEYGDVAGVGYAGKDEHELLTTAMTNMEAVKILSSMPSKRGFLTRFSDFVSGLLGAIGIPRTSSRYTDLVSSAEVLMRQRVQYTSDVAGADASITKGFDVSYAEPLAEAQGAVDAEKQDARISAIGQRVQGRTKQYLDEAENFRDIVETRPEAQRIRARLNAFYGAFRKKLPEGFTNVWEKYMDSIGMNLSRSDNHFSRWVSSWLTEVGNGLGRNGSSAGMHFQRTMLDYRQKYVSRLNEALGTYLFGDYGSKSFAAISAGMYSQDKSTKFWAATQEYRLQRRHDLLAGREPGTYKVDPSIAMAADAMDAAAAEYAQILDTYKLPEGEEIRTGTKAGTTGYIRYQFEAEVLRQLVPEKQKAVADELVNQYFKKYMARDEKIRQLKSDPEGFTLQAHDGMNQRLEKLIEDADSAEQAGDAQRATALRGLQVALRKQIQALEANPEAFVQAQFLQMENASKKMAEDHGRGYWSRIIQNHEVRADGTTAWAQELGKRILEQDFNGQEITPEIAKLWKESLQEQMQDRTRMELDLLNTFGDNQRLLDYIQLNGNAMISSQGRAAAGRSALARFGITQDSDADAVLDAATQAGCSDKDIQAMKKMLDLYQGRLSADPETEALASFMSNLAYVTMMSKQSVQLFSDAGNAIQWSGMGAAMNLVARALGNIATLKAFKRSYDPKTLKTAEGQLYAFFPGSVGEQFNAFMPNVEKIIGDVQPDQGVATRVMANARNIAGHAFGSMLVGREMQLGMLKLAAQGVTTSVITGKNWTEERMQIAGLTPEIVSRIRKQFEKYSPELMASEGREGRANWHQWDDNEALELYRDAVVRVKGYMTLEENPGEQQAWAVSSPLARILLQFRGAGMRSAEKLSAAEFGVQGVAAGQTMMMQMLWAGMLYGVRSLLAASVLGDDEAEKYWDERQKPSDINFQAWLNLIPMSGLASDFVGIGGVFFGQGGVAGAFAPAGPEAMDRLLKTPSQLVDGNFTGVPILNSPFIMGPAVQLLNAVGK